MDSRNTGFTKALVMTFIFLTTTSSHAVLAQAEGHSSMAIDFGILGRGGSCDVSSDEYNFDLDGIACLVIEYRATSNARFNLSMWSDSYSGFELERVEMIVTPESGTRHVILINPAIPDHFSYGESQLLIDIEDWNPLSEEIPTPIINFNYHRLIIKSPDYNLHGEFRYEDSRIEVPEFGDIRGVLTNYNHGDSGFAVRPVLMHEGNIISSADEFSIRSMEISDRRVSFPFPDSLEVGIHSVQVALQNLRDPLHKNLWEQDIEIVVTTSSGSVDTLFALWDISSFEGPSSLGAYSGDMVNLLVNQTNPGSLASTSDLWVNFLSGADCFPVNLGPVTLEAGEMTTSSFRVEIPESLDDGMSLDAELSPSSCSSSPIVELDGISVFDRPTSISATLYSNVQPNEFNGVDFIPISFQVMNLEEYEISDLQASVALYAMGRNIGDWSGDISLDKGETGEYTVEIDSAYCYDGDVDASLEIRDRNGEILHSSLSQNSIRSYFHEGEFEMQSELDSTGSVPLGSPIRIFTNVNALTSNPDDCVMLIPLMSVFSPVDSSFSPLTEISLLEISSGESMLSSLDTSISYSSGTYKISQHLMRSFSNDSSEDWITSTAEFTELEVTESSPEFIIHNCDSHSSWDFVRYNIEIGCEIESRSPFGTLVRFGTVIGDSIIWDKPLRIDSNDAVDIAVSRPYSIGEGFQATLVAEALWDGVWVELAGQIKSFEIELIDEIDGREPFPGEHATTQPSFPLGGESFSVKFHAIGSDLWRHGSYEVTIWLDPSKEGAAYASPRLSHGLAIGEHGLLEVGFEKWPDTCGLMPYEIIARDSEGTVLDKIESEFEGCSIELIDLSLVGQMEISQCEHVLCFVRITVANDGMRDYSPKTVAEQADVTLIIDGKIIQSSVTIPPLDIGDESVLEVGVPVSGFQDIRLILDGDGKYSDLDRSNNGLGWSSANGPVIFENDSDFDGLSNEFEMNGYDISPLTSRSSIIDMVLFLDDPLNNSLPLVETKRVTSDPLRHDSDNDGLSDFLEWKIGSDASSIDTDGDNYSDLEEYDSVNHDPSMVELEPPVIRVSEPIQKRIDVVGIPTPFVQHTRSVYIEDRNFERALVTISNSDETKTYVYEPHESDGDIHHFTVTYVFSDLSIEESEVTVTAYDKLGNVANLEIANQDNIWDRATNKISSWSTNMLIEALGPIIGPGVLGFLTGLTYGIKDIYEIVTGIVPLLKALAKSFHGALSAFGEIIEDCVPESFQSDSGEPIRMPGDCLLVGLDLDDILQGMTKIGDAAWKAGKKMEADFISLSPYDNRSTEQRTFLGFTVIGFLTIEVLSGVILLKGLKAVGTVTGAIEDLVSTLGNTKRGALTTMESAVARAGGGVKAGAQSSILSKFPTISTGASIGDAVATVGAVKAGKVSVDRMYDAYDLIKKTKSSPSLHRDVTTDPDFFDVLEKKDLVLDDLGSPEKWDDLLDIYVASSSKFCFKPKVGNNCKGLIREDYVNLKGGERGVFEPLNWKQVKHVGREADGLEITPGSLNSKPKVKIIESKEVNEWMQEMWRDFQGKADPGRPSGDIAWMKRACDGFTTDECRRLLMKPDDPSICNGITREMCERISDNSPKSSGLSPESADILSKCIKDSSSCDWEIQYDISGMTDQKRAANQVWAEKKHGELVEKFPENPEIAEEWYRAYYGSEDLAGPVFDELFKGSQKFSVQSGLVFPADQGKPFMWGAMWLTFVTSSVTITFFAIGWRVMSNRN